MVPLILGNPKMGSWTGSRRCDLRDVAYRRVGKVLVTLTLSAQAALATLVLTSSCRLKVQGY